MNNIQTREHQIQFDLKWLSLVDLSQALADPTLRDKILELLQEIEKFTQILPSNPYWPEANKIIKKIKKLDKENKLEYPADIHGENPEPKAKAYIQTLGLLNQTRIELNTSINLLKHFTQATEKHHISQANQALGFIGLGIPITNLVISAYQAFVKWYIDKTNAQKTQELKYYLEQNRLQIIKTSFIASLNLSIIIASLLESTALSIYFNLANLCLEFFFIHLNHLKTKTKLLTRNLELLENFKKLKTEADENQTIDSKFILDKLKSAEIDQKTRLQMIEFLMNEQQLKSNDYLYYFQFTIFTLMLTNIVVLNASGIMDYHAVILVSILSTYIYNCIQPYLSNLFLALMQREKHEVTDGLGQTLVIQQGKLLNPKSKKNQYLSPDMLFALITKSMLPILITTLTPTLGPLVAIGLVCSVQLLIAMSEYAIRQFKPNKIEKPEEEIYSPEPPKFPQLDME